MKQIWLKITTKTFLCFVSVRHSKNVDAIDKFIVQLYFQVSSSSVSKEMTYSMYNIVFFNRSLAYRFAKSMHMSLLQTDETPLYPNRPLDGAVGIEAITLSQTANDEVKFRIILKSAHPQQKTFRDVYVPRVQSWARRTLAKRYAKRLRKAIIVIKRNVKKWVKNKQIFDEQARKRKKKNRKKKARKKMIQKVNRIQAFWRKRKFRKENLYMTKFAIEVLKFNRTIDTVIEKLKPHYDEIIEKLQDICRQVRQKSISCSLWKLW